MFLFDDDGELEPLPPMHDSRWLLTCAAVARCIIVAEGAPQCKSSKVYDEVRGKWLRLPCDLPSAGGLVHMGSAFLQNPGACSRALCSCVTVGMCPSHAELGVLVDDTVVRRLGWSVANESDDYVRQNYNN